MTNEEESAYMRGSRAVYQEMLSIALRGLSVEPVPDTPDGMRKRIAQLEMIHAQTIAALREICDEFGNNDWDDDLHPADVIEKHLARPLRDAADEEREDPPS